jgi:hypothetical protein
MVHGGNVRVSTLARIGGAQRTTWVGLLGRNTSGQPARSTQEPRIAVARADELNPEGQTAGALQQWQADARHAAKRPQGTEGWIAGGCESFRGRAWGCRRQNRIVALLEQLEKAFVNGSDSGQRPLIVECRHLPSLFDLFAQSFRELFTGYRVFVFQI